MSSWRALLLRIGDKGPEYGGTTDFKEHIETCFGLLMREIEHADDEILDFLLQCAEQLPHKVPFYGTLKVVETTQANLQDALNTGDCDRIKYFNAMMRQEILLGKHVRFYIRCILSSLPWGGAELIEQVPDEIERVMVGIEAYLSIRKRTYDIGVSVFEFDDESVKARNEKDFLEDLWDRIKVLSNNGWKVDSVPRLHLPFEAQLVVGKSHDFAPISCPEQPEPPSTLSGITFLMLFCFCHSSPPIGQQDLQPIDRFIVEEYLLDVLLFFNGWFNVHCIWLVYMSPFRYEYLMAETIFSQLLLLPEPPFKPMYYTLVIIDLCSSRAFPAVVAGAVRALFERIADLDMECRMRLILWFSHHLSNFQFVWPWEEWIHVLDLPKWAPQRVFLFRKPRACTILELSRLVKGRSVARDVISWIEETIIPVHGPQIALEVVIHTLLDIGSKSFTHLITVLERYGQVIAKLCPDQDKQVMLIDEVSSYWKNSAQMTAVTIDRMMGYRLISNLAIVRWVFSPANFDQFHLILRNTINKTYNRICDLRREISTLSKSVSKAAEAASQAKAELEAAETKITLRDGEPVQGEGPVRMKRLTSIAEKANEELVSARDTLEAKEALLARALEENEALFISLYKRFSDVLAERLPVASPDGTIRTLRGQTDNMVVDSEEPSEMEVDENGKSRKSDHLNGVSNGYNIGEKEQWCLTTLGYVKAFSRQYAAEIWPHIEKLDAEVFTEDISPLFRKAIYSGLRRPINGV
ncbi:hypothetical protein MKW92_027666 [Papaver armeniacum]|nr:hypothetical protein MKW92_027666 [Papaver armeniacum]